MRARGGRPIKLLAFAAGRIKLPAVLLLLLALGLGLGFSRAGAVLDGAFLDLAAPLLGRPRPAPGLVVVLITEKDYQERATPMALWGLHLAALWQKLAAAGPAAVGLDLVLPHFLLARFLPEHDRAVFSSLAVLAQKTRLAAGYGVTSSGGVEAPFPVYGRIVGPAGMGFFNLTPDPDGICRSQDLAWSRADGGGLVAFAAALAGARPRPGARIMPDWRNPARFKTLSFAQALAAPAGEFRGKAVLVGVDWNFEDRHRSPAAPQGEPGVIWQARVVEALLSGRSLWDPGRLWALLLPALLLVPAWLAATRKAGQAATAWLAAGGLAAALLLCGLSLSLGLLALPSAALLGVLLAGAWRLAAGYLRTRELFGRYVAPQVRDHILAGRIPLAGEIRQVTVLFADLRNFTPLNESQPPQVVVGLVNRYFQAMSRVIREHRGLVMQYVGDEIFAVFGAPLDLPDHGEWAIKAGLAMIAAMEGLNRELSAEGLPALAQGIGIHGGPVLAGNVGGAGRLSYALVGDTVNLGSRLQGLNKEFGARIIASGAVRAGLEGRFAWRELPTVPIKGKSKPVAIYTLEI